MIDRDGQQSIYIADGHHATRPRCNIRRKPKAANGGAAAGRSSGELLHVLLVGMQDPGPDDFADAPPIGGLTAFDFQSLQSVTPNFESGTGRCARSIGEAATKWPAAIPAPSACTMARPSGLLNAPDQSSICSRPWSPTKAKPGANWDVAILQRYLLDEIIQPKFGGGRKSPKATPPTPAKSPRRWMERNIRSRCCSARRHCMRWRNWASNGEVMPQKSTFLYQNWRRGW